MSGRGGLRTGLTALLLLAVLLLASIVSLGVGSVSIPAGQTARVLASRLPVVGASVDTSDVPDGLRDIILRVRPPRVVVAVLVGMALALAGAVMQGFFQNPMADPYIVGVSSGAAFGATIALALRVEYFVLGVSSVSVFAFAGALGVTALVYALARRGGRILTGTLLLTGIAVGSLVSGLTSFVLLYGSDDLRPVVQWMMGNLSGRQWSHVRMVLPYVAVGLPLALLYARDLNALVAGDEPAAYMGVDVDRTRTALLVLSAVLAAASVAAAGIIGFVGLVVPHVMRLLIGPDHRKLLPMSALGGAVLLVLADILSRVAGPYEEIPIGIVTTILGCPFFLFLLSRSREARF